MHYLAEGLIKKWQPVLDSEHLAPIKDRHRRAVTATMLENSERELSGTGGQFLFEEPIPANNMGAGNIATFDPVLISLVRRTMPNLMAYDVCGVQPMTGPSGIIFALRPRYTSQTGAENFYNEVNTMFSTVVSGANTIGLKQVGTVPGVSNNAANGTYNFAGGMATAQLEALGSDSNSAFAEVAMSLEKITVTAKGRGLAAGYTQEEAQDLKAIHGLEAEGELSNIITTELLAEMNREVVRTILVTAVSGAQADTTTAGVFNLDVDSNGRWAVEKFKGLMFQVEREANQIAKTTRRGRGNIIVCSSDVSSALAAAGILDYTPALTSNNLQVDDTGNTFVGVLNGKYKVYIDPYASGGDYMVIGYKGSSMFDAGLFYCPYVPLQMMRAVDPQSFQPRIGFKTRYGIVSNPFAQGGTTTNPGAILADSNYFYRRVIVQKIM